LFLVAYLKDSGMVEFEDDKVLPSVLKWTTVKVAKIGYEQVFFGQVRNSHGWRIKRNEQILQK
jgi:hypothetical protein